MSIRRKGQSGAREFYRTHGPCSAKLAEPCRTCQRARRHRGGFGQRNWRNRLWNQPTLTLRVAEDRQVVPATEGETRGHAEPVVPPCFFCNFRISAASKRGAKYAYSVVIHRYKSVIKRSQRLKIGNNTFPEAPAIPTVQRLWFQGCPVRGMPDLRGWSGRGLGGRRVSG